MDKRTYRIWADMKQRCNNNNDKDYRYYGGRGIHYEQKWDSFEGFLEDMGNSPTGMTLDRINTNGHYSKSNCRWATKKEQSNNTRRNVHITFKGITKTIAQWSDETGINYQTLHTRFVVYGWSAEDSLTRPIKRRFYG